MCHLFRTQRADESDFHKSVCPAKTAKDKRCPCAVLGLVWWMYFSLCLQNKKMNVNLT